jgi:tetratricopeptide (TPR) repeat protein
MEDNWLPNMNNYLPPLAILGSIFLISYTVPALALSPVEVQRIAKQTTVRIKGCDNASGVIIKKTGNVYAVLTAAHATRATGCQVVTGDDNEYGVTEVTPFIDSIDLATIEFKSNKNYPVAKYIDNSDRVESGESIYISGFPVTGTISEPIFTFVQGRVVGNGNKLQKKGYSMVYDNPTLPGHSGGPVWNDRAEIIAIHGQGDVDTKLKDTDNPDIRIKTGFNLGITINTFVKIATMMGKTEYLASAPVRKVAVAPPKPVDDLIASAISRESKGDYRGILADMNQAISINPQKDRLFYIRGNAKSELGDRQGAIDDYSRDIAMNPKRAEAYYNRGNIRYKLGDWQQALADYSSSIEINPQRVAAFYNRANVKYKLKDKQGAIDDYTRAIAVNPTLLAAYSSRGWVKYELGDYQGSIADNNLAIAMNHPLLSKVYSQKAFAQYELGNKAEAIGSWRKALNLPNIMPDTQLGLAIALYAQGKQEEAFPLGEAAIRNNKKLIDVDYLRDDKKWGKSMLQDAAPFLQTPRMRAMR